MIIQGGISIMISATFYFAGQANVNSGIISSIFCSSVIFTAITFFFIYG